MIIQSLQPVDADSEEDRRLFGRQPFPGGEVFIFIDERMHHRLRLKDLSCRGVCGLTDMPLTIGQIVVVQLEEMLMPSAEVRWVKHSMVGLNFIRPIPLAKLKRLCERHKAGARWSPAMRAAPAVTGWWNEASAARR